MDYNHFYLDLLATRKMDPSVRTLFEITSNTLDGDIPHNNDQPFFMYTQTHKRKLDAGPIFIMSTIMLLIFTIGLGESKEKVDGEEEHWSAYSVFNRGCQSLLGAMNVEDLVAQHVGGGLHLGFRGQDNNDHNRDDDMGAQNRQRRRRRPEPLNNAGDVNQAAPAAVANNQARKSGKKLRRQNLELRREAQRQRQAAAAFGFGGVDETEAMNRLLEEQAAAIEVMEENDDDHDGNLAAILAVLEE